jgi:hypothetical protein
MRLNAAFAPKLLGGVVTIKAYSHWHHEDADLPGGQRHAQLALRGGIHEDDAIQTADIQSGEIILDSMKRDG